MTTEILLLHSYELLVHRPNHKYRSNHRTATELDNVLNALGGVINAVDADSSSRPFTGLLRQNGLK